HLASAAAFAAIVLASWVEQPRWLLSYPISIVTALVSDAQPAPLIANASAEEAAPVATTGEPDTGPVGFTPRNAGSAEPIAAARRDTTALAPWLPVNSSLTDVAPLIEPLPAPPATTGVTTPPVVAAVSSPAPVPVAPVALTLPPPAETPRIVESKPPDDTLVRRTLQQYKTAYDALDARSARAVWPVVNERALARAFDGLQSQNLT